MGSLSSEKKSKKKIGAPGIMNKGDSLNICD